MLAMTKIIRCAAVQMVSGDDLDANLLQAEKLVDKAAKKGAKLVVLPENFAVFSSGLYSQIGIKECDNTGPIRQFLSSLAKKYQLWLVAGSIPCSQPSSLGLNPKPLVFTSCLVFNPNGQEVARYNKLHLFDVDVGDAQGSYRESAQFAHGDEAVFIDIEGIKTGLSICYDIRFPELYRYFLQNQCQLFAVPAAFTYKTGEAHWLTLLKARAIENNAFVIAANQGGEHSKKRITYGHSCIISPWGEVLEVLASGEGVVVADLDFEMLAQQRKSLPVQQHQRLFVSASGLSKVFK